MRHLLAAVAFWPLILAAPARAEVPTLVEEGTPPSDSSRAAGGRAVTSFARSCYVFFEPYNDARRMCLKKAGAPVSFRQQVGNGWVQIETADCNGYVADACLVEPGYESRRTIVEDPHTRRNTVRIVAQGHFNGNLGKVPGNDTSRGDGYGLMARVQIPIFERVRLNVSPLYQVLGLTRTVDMSGALKDPSPAEFTHTLKFLGLGLSAEWTLLRNYLDGRATLDPEFAVELGFEYLTPVGALQTDKNGTVTRFTSNDRPFLLYLGATLDIGLSSRASLVVYLNGYYNLRSGNGNSFYGGRLGAGLAFAL